MGDDHEGAIPDMYKDRLQSHQERIANLIGEKLERTAGPRRKPYSKVTWTVVENYISHDDPEVTQMRNEQESNVGYKDMDVLLRKEHFQDTLSALCDGTSYSQNCLCVTDMSKCTIFAKI